MIHDSSLDQLVDRVCRRWVAQWRAEAARKEDPADPRGVDDRLAGAGALMSACGGTNNMGGAGGTPVGTYNLTVKGTIKLGSVTTNRVAKLTLIVQ